ncbi:MAG: T9SS type A sorting domain-containing protein [Candidatus Marinimicrobia bacterium]|nr:T9SS type A sorting domain-containing protein [Candidatus Neomarinimicrobiota bacterium]MCF7828305.1 T9SS type A sorting domain-containing protein [Candidatus Neomarinimicrobiota bacterium]MCF7879520.1 T9SS type A sorting domain-containing protein [Candidatus Neomarinimicrobiota bacterium]
MKHNKFPGSQKILFLIAMFVLIASGQTIYALPPVDLVVDREIIVASLKGGGNTTEPVITTINSLGDPCFIDEGCLSGEGERTILRFGTRIANRGNDTLNLGNPEDPNNPYADYWHYHACHDHDHFDAFAEYHLFDLSGNELSGGHKAGFNVYDYGPGDCGEFSAEDPLQGISPGCYDFYGMDLDCQWVDITGIQDGFYILKITTNPDEVIPESDYSNNHASVLLWLSTSDDQPDVDPYYPRPTLSNRVIGSGDEVPLETKYPITTGTSYTIQSGGTVSFLSTDGITLNSGFTADMGSAFYATVRPVLTGGGLGYPGYGEPGFIKQTSNEKAYKLAHEQMPTDYNLYQNYPNPFNPDTRVEYALPEANVVTITVYNSLGQKVKTVVDAHKPAGTHTVLWDGTNQAGNPVSSGMYIFRIRAGDFTKSIKVNKIM